MCSAIIIAPQVFAQQQDNSVEILDSQYVTDKLRLSLYKDANSSSETLKLLSSGDQLDIIEKQGPYSKVVTSDGQTGWVKNGFLVTIPPAVLQLSAAEQTIKQLNKELDQFGDTRSLVEDYRKQISDLTQQLTQKTNREIFLNQALERLKQDTEPVQQQTDEELVDLQQILKNYFIEFGLLTFLLLVLLFLTGYWVGQALIAQKVRKRFQGIKVW